MIEVIFNSQVLNFYSGLMIGMGIGGIITAAVFLWEKPS